jgi:hypothetical protein
MATGDSSAPARRGAASRPATSASWLSNRYLFFALASLSLLMFSIDSTIVAVALPTMMQELRTPFLAVNVYYFLYGAPVSSEHG